MYKQALMRGDYGRFRRGDPGFLSNAFRGITGALGGAVRSLVTGGNPIAGAITGAVSGVRGAIQQSVTPPAFSLAGGPGVSLAVPSQLRPGAPMIVGSTMMGVSPAGTFGMVTRKGTHANRSSYWTSQGYVQKGTKLVTNRSTNYGNGRALRRALKRAHGFQHLAKAVMSFTLTGKKHGPAHFKARPRARGR